MGIDLNDWIDDDTGQLDPGGLGDWIEKLKLRREEDEDAGLPWDEDDAAELASLIDFRAQVESVTGEQMWASVLVPDAEFDKHTRYWANSEHGLEDSDLAQFIEWHNFMRQQQRDRWKALDLDGDTIWVQLR